MKNIYTSKFRSEVTIVARVEVDEDESGTFVDIVVRGLNLFVQTSFDIEFFPPSKTTNLRNEITRFQQRFNESFYEAWDRFNDLLRAYPHHGFSELHQLDTFYNALNVNDQDSLNSAAGGNFLDNMPCLKIIESKSKVCQSRAKAVVAKVSTSSSTPAISSDVAELKDMVRALHLDKKNQSSAPAPSPTPAPVKAVEPNCVTCGGAHSYQSCPATNENDYRDNIQEYVSQATATNYNQGNTGFRPLMVANHIRPLGFPPVQNNQNNFNRGNNFKQNRGVSDPVVASVSAPTPNLKSSIPYPSRRDNKNRYDQANEQIEKFYEIFKDMSFEISFTDALILMPKFASTLKALIGNKEKLSEMARTLMNEHFSVVILNKLPRKLGDPGKFLIPCEFPGMDECLALAYLGASINLMPLSVWEGLSLSELTPTCMTLELAERSVSKPIGITKDVSVKGELTLRIGNEAITYNLDQTARYSANYNQMMANKIDVICEEYSQEVLGFSDVTVSGNLTLYDNPIVSTTSLTLTPFGDSDFLLFEEADVFLGLEDDPNSPKINPFYYDLEGDILLLEAILNSEPLPPFPNHEQYMPSFKKELKVCETKTVKSFVAEPPEVELKDLPPHLEYAFLEGDNKFPVIIAKELGDEEKSDMIKVLKSHKRAIAWKLSDIHGIFKFPLTLAIRRKLHSPALTERLPIIACLSVCVMHRAHFKGEKSHFMVKEGIVLGHKISKNAIKVDKAKVDVIAKLPHPTIVKAPILIAPNWDLPFELMYDASDFTIGAVLGQRHEKHFRPIHYASKTMTDAESNYTTTEKEMLAIVYVFEKFQSYLIMNKSIVHTDHSALKYLFAKKDAKARLLRWVLLIQEFDFKVLDTKGAENLAADHLSRLENPYENVLDPKEINETFPLETLSMVTFRDDSSAPWFEDFANYHAGNFIVNGMSSQ
nr:reverse transcriptase domain-containing protein [Tanacetum cinerariifolium]